MIIPQTPLIYEKLILDRKIINSYIEKVKQLLLEQEQFNHIQELMKIGIELFNSQKYKNARQVFLDILSLDPKNAQAKQYLSRCNRELKKTKDTEKEIKEETGDKKILEEKNIQDLKNLEEAEKSYQQSLIYYANGQLELAINELKRTLKLNPQHERAINALEKIQKELKK